MKHFFYFLLKPALIGLSIALVWVGSTYLYQNHLESKPVSYADAVQKASPAVVNIYNLQSTSSLGRAKIQNLGSGVVMTPDGYILTNYHVIKHANQVLITLQNGQEFFSQLVGIDELTDLAVLKIEGTNLPTIPIQKNLKSQVGDVVLAIGNPYNIGQTITQGIISATGRIGLSNTQQQFFLQTDAAINKGNSGGALINSQGTLVGINTAAYQLGEGIHLAIPFVLAYKVMNQLIKHGEVIRGMIGIKGEKVPYPMAQIRNIENPNAILLNHVPKNFPAQKAGLKPQDIILSINDRPIESAMMLNDTIAEHPIGQKIKLTIDRNGQHKTIFVVVQKRP